MVHLTKRSAGRPLVACDGGNVRSHRQQRFLRKILQNYLLVEKSSHLEAENNDSVIPMPIKPTRQCYFEIDFSDKDDYRIPKVIPRAVCPKGKCSPACKKVTTKWAVLQKKCISKRATIFSLKFVDVDIGFIREAPPVLF